MDDIYNPNKKCKALIIFYNMIVDILTTKKLNPIVTVLFIRGRNLNISLFFITQSSLVFITKCYVAVPKNVRPNSTQYFIMKILNKRELQQIAFSHKPDIYFRDLQNLIRFSYW